MLCAAPLCAVSSIPYVLTIFFSILVDPIFLCHCNATEFLTVCFQVSCNPSKFFRGGMKVRKARLVLETPSSIGTYFSLTYIIPS